MIMELWKLKRVLRRMTAPYSNFCPTGSATEVSDCGPTSVTFENTGEVNGD